MCVCVRVEGDACVRVGNSYVCVFLETWREPSTLKEEEEAWKAKSRSVRLRA